MGLLIETTFTRLVCTAVPLRWHKGETCAADGKPFAPIVGTTYHAAKKFPLSEWWQFWPVSEGDPRIAHKSYCNQWTSLQPAWFVVREAEVVWAFTEAEQKEQEAA